MTFSVSAIALLLLATVVVFKLRSAKFGAALVLFLLGFFVAGTGASGPIRTLCASFAHFLATLHA